MLGVPDVEAKAWRLVFPKMVWGSAWAHTAPRDGKYFGLSCAFVFLIFASKFVPLWGNVPSVYIFKEIWLVKVFRLSICLLPVGNLIRFSFFREKKNVWITLCFVSTVFLICDQMRVTLNFNWWLTLFISLQFSCLHAQECVFVFFMIVLWSTFWNCRDYQQSIGMA